MPTTTVQPTANTTPDQGATSAVTSPSNTGHGETVAAASATGLAPSGSDSASQSLSCRWSSFQSVSGQLKSVHLKFTWSATSLLTVLPASDGSADASASFAIQYTLNGGSSWTDVTNQAGTFSTGASENITLSLPQDISQIQVRNLMSAAASATAGTVDNSTASSSVTATISGIQLEIETVQPQMVVMM